MHTSAGGGSSSKGRRLMHPPAVFPSPRQQGGRGEGAPFPNCCRLTFQRAKAKGRGSDVTGGMTAYLTRIPNEKIQSN